MTRHLLVTNDFPPKVGGIQSYLWELWRRLPADDVTVLTTAFEGASRWDASQPFRIERTREAVLLPTASLRQRVERLASEVDAQLIVVDPVAPAGGMAPKLSRPYVVVMHGSELVGRLPVGGRWASHVLRHASHVVCAGEYPASETRRLSGGMAPPITIIPPGVDTCRFRPLAPAARAAARRRFGFDPEAKLVVGVSRLVPRKGFDVLLRAAGRLDRPDLTVAIGGAGRDGARLQKLIDAERLPGRLVGRVTDNDLPEFYGAADLFGMLCRSRWGGLEIEGFGIVFVEAAACGVPQVGGASGGAADAVANGTTGVVVSQPRNVDMVAEALAALLDDDDRREAMAAASRQRAEAEYDYDVLAARLSGVLASVPAGP